MFENLKKSLIVCAVVASASAYAQTDSAEIAEPRVGWYIDAVSEGQWNMSDRRGNWANMLSAGLEVRSWRGGRIELGALATGQLKEGILDDLQNFSNINAESRLFRLTHLGVGQRIGNRFSVYAGLREADEDYFNTDGAGIFTGSSYGCVPQVGENFCVGVYPDAALGLHFEYQPAEAWAVRLSVYNGAASDRLNRQFRFRPGRDGMINLGSVSFSPALSNYLDADGEPAEGFLAPNYVIGYAAGWQYDDGDEANSGRDRRTGGAIWVSVDQPLLRVGHAGLNLFATGGVRLGQLDAARGHWAAALMLNNITRRGGTLAVGASQAHYADGINETDYETTFEYPLFSWLCLQPAFHVIRTDGGTNLAGNLRLNISLGNL